MRPLAGGKGSFRRIVENLHHALDYLDITIRMNVDTGNVGHAGELFQILAAEGFGGRLSVYPGQIVGINDGAPSPSATYGAYCLTNPEFARTKREFVKLAMGYGFSGPTLPRPTGAPCTAVRANELVVGSKGELYKCWDSVGNQREVIGDIRDYRNANGRLAKWLKYGPFADSECRGCAHHAMDLLQYENRCGTFRHTYGEQVLQFVEVAEQHGLDTLTAAPQLARRIETR